MLLASWTTLERLLFWLVLLGSMSHLMISVELKLLKRSRKLQALLWLTIDDIDESINISSKSSMFLFSVHHVSQLHHRTLKSLAARNIWAWYEGITRKLLSLFRYPIVAGSNGSCLQLFSMIFRGYDMNRCAFFFFFFSGHFLETIKWQDFFCKRKYVIIGLIEKNIWLPTYWKEFTKHSIGTFWRSLHLRIGDFC